MLRTQMHVRRSLLKNSFSELFVISISILTGHLDGNWNIKKNKYVSYCYLYDDDDIDRK